MLPHLPTRQTQVISPHRWHRWAGRGGFPRSPAFGSSCIGTAHTINSAYRTRGRKAKHGKNTGEQTNPYQPAVYQVRAPVRRLGMFRVYRDRRQRHPRMDAGRGRDDGHQLPPLWIRIRSHRGRPPLTNRNSCDAGAKLQRVPRITYTGSPVSEKTSCRKPTGSEAQKEGQGCY